MLKLELSTFWLVDSVDPESWLADRPPADTGMAAFDAVFLGGRRLLCKLTEKKFKKLIGYLGVSLKLRDVEIGWSLILENYWQTIFKLTNRKFINYQIFSINYTN